MSRKVFSFISLFILLSILLASCSGTSSTSYNGMKGSAAASGTVCKSTDGQGECSGELNQLSGIFTKSFEDKDLLASDRTVAVEAVISVGSGTVNAFVMGSGDVKTALEIKAGETATLTGNASVISKKFNVFFEAVDGEATR